MVISFGMAIRILERELMFQFNRGSFAFRTKNKDLSRTLFFRIKKNKKC
jgi:hypothetical protein